MSYRYHSAILDICLHECSIYNLTEDIQISTFFGGNQLIEVKNISSSGSSVSGAKYTVPAGRFAEVFIQKSTNNNMQFAVTSSGFNVIIDATSSYSSTAGVPFQLFAGNSIVQNSSTVSTYDFLIKEYKLP